MAVIFEIGKSPYLGKGSTHVQEIWRNDSHRPRDMVIRLNSLCTVQWSIFNVNKFEQFNAWVHALNPDKVGATKS